MITIQSKTRAEHVGGLPIFDFLINPTDSAYQEWWPGMHLEYHTLRQTPGHVGDVVYMDEYIGSRRVKMTGIVTEAEPGRRITWQLKSVIRLPIWLCVVIEDDGDGVAITHTIRVGFGGVGSIFDPIFRAYFSEEFAKMMDEHARTEFPRLGDMLASVKRQAEPASLHV